MTRVSIAGNNKVCGKCSVMDVLNEYDGSDIRNDRKVLICMYLRDLIMEKSSKEKPISQKTLIHLLDVRHDILVERKALSRNLHTLADESHVYIHLTSRGQAYYDKDEAREDREAREARQRYLAA